MDIEHQRKYVPKYLKYLLPQNPAPPEIAPNLEKLREFTKYEQRQIAIDFIAEIGADIAQNEQVFRDYFGENYFDFELAVENFNDWTELEKYNHNRDPLKWDALREANMVDNVMRTVEHYKPSGKFYGEWGSHHTIRKRVDKDRMRLAAELEAKGSPIAGRVCSILNVYINCQGRNTNNTTFEPKNKWSEEVLLDFTKFGNGDVTLFKLLGKTARTKQTPSLTEMPTAL